MKPSLDIVFLSYDESNAEENFLELKARFPRAKRVHGVKGIYHAHKAAGELSETHHFFLVDGDNKILEDFDFSYDQLNLKDDTIYVWRCLNPINQLAYGYGAVKIYNQSLLRENDRVFRDLATSVARHYHIVHEVASETHFFATPLEAWRGAYRECAKLMSQVMENESDRHSAERLNTWCSQADPRLENSNWVLKGANMGAELARELAGDKSKIRGIINDFSELTRRFEQTSL